MTGKRAATRARIDREIMEAARNQLAEVGAAGLSLREVARDVGMVSSAVYRYVDSREALLTRLIIDAYDELGERTERTSAAHAGAPDLDRWAATAHEVRAWALEHPQRYLLLYGSPVPGYAAPDDTVGPATRVTLALVGVLVDAHIAGRLAAPADPPATPTPALHDDLIRLSNDVAGKVTSDTVLAFLVAWTQLFGLIGFELTSQTRNVITDHAGLFDAAIRRVGHQLGLR